MKSAYEPTAAADGASGASGLGGTHAGSTTFVAVATHESLQSFNARFVPAHPSRTRSLDDYNLKAPTTTIPANRNHTAPNAKTAMA